MIIMSKAHFLLAKVSRNNLRKNLPRKFRKVKMSKLKTAWMKYWKDGLD